MRNGLVALMHLGCDGVFKLRVTDGELTSGERDYAACCLELLGLTVESGLIRVSGFGSPGPRTCLSRFHVVRTR